ncbi:unnamed protein product [Spirodela intermedia]|uniref:Fungal lipase-type domain-containing protein n=1 Tax=Spirodela intermedia TaxID=51605 RepID=A0A7I8JEI1_SPIIN|nr:unnamed protein product [Spirodela intermedia]CAA6668175.1 unnamed protein product [Spirodela intermedia]
MASLRSRLEAWIREQTAKMGALTWWPPWWRDVGKKEQEKRLREEFELRRRQLQDLCGAVKAESIADLQEVICSMVLSECVYKRPASEVIRVINKFKADFGGQVVSLERVQPSLDHVPHRYLLAEAGDTLFASFIGTKQYKDVIADANILQGVIFPEETVDNIEDSENKMEEKLTKQILPKSNGLQKKSKPAAHRGFLARAKGIPALELYKLAQKKKRKLVLCGHSLGGAVAALATLAILRVIASSSSKDQVEVQIKCITFSQPPVGNAALRDYVHHKGWQQYFKSYCIPEDLIPRILSPAYFDHYNAQPPQSPVDARVSGSSSLKSEEGTKRPSTAENKEGNKEQLVMGLGPVQTSLWRLSKLVPLRGVWKQLDRFKGRRYRSGENSENGPSSLEIQEGIDGISLSPIPTVDKEMVSEEKNGHTADRNSLEIGSAWRSVPYLPSYVPFGKLYLLGNSSVDFLSDSEYSKLTSVRSVISELRERFQSHSMRSYRSRFQRIYDLFMSTNATPFLGGEQLSQFPHLQQWLGLSAAGTVELGHVVESPVIQTATSINVEPLKVDVTGNGLHLCSLVQAQVNGNWCSTVLESPPPMPPNYLNHSEAQDLQKIRVLIGPPLKRPLKHPASTSLFPISHLLPPRRRRASSRSQSTHPLNDLVIYCTSDFVTVCKEVYVRTRRVRLLGSSSGSLQGSGKTALFNSIVGEGRPRRETIAGGLCYLDSAGSICRQNFIIIDLQSEAERFRRSCRRGRGSEEEDGLRCAGAQPGAQDPKDRRPGSGNMAERRPALAAFLEEAETRGVPWVLAITNNSPSALISRGCSSAPPWRPTAPAPTRQRSPIPLPTSSPALAVPPWGTRQGGRPAQRLAFVRMPFQKKKAVMPIEGVPALRRLVHRVLLSREEAALEVGGGAGVQKASGGGEAGGELQESSSGGALTAAAVGASLGAGLGIVMAIVMGAGSALRKP